MSLKYINNQDTFAIDEIYSVSDFLSLVNNFIDKNIPALWISGELSSIVTAKSGHIYFSLRNDTSVIRCVLFKFGAKHLAFELQSGIKVMVYASLNVYEPRGDMQLVVSKVEPVGLGGIELALKQLTTKLRRLGLFDSKHKKPIYQTPKKIGIITSASGAAIQDIIKTLNTRYPYANLIVYDVNTQGDLAISQIINALKIADNSDLDTIIIARGGGSIEDLYVFNDENLAYAVFNAKTPIISSIGHEIDKHIIDFIADKSAITPTAAVIIATIDKSEILKTHKLLTDKLIYNANLLAKNKKENFININDRLLIPKLNQYINVLHDYALRMRKSVNNNLKLDNAKLGNYYALLLKHNPHLTIFNKQKVRQISNTRILAIMAMIIKNNKTTIKNLLHRINHNIQIQILNNHNNLKQHVSHLNHLNPLKVLARGYNITFDSKNQIITNANDANINDEIITKLANGIIVSRVIKTNVYAK